VPLILVIIGYEFVLWCRETYFNIRQHNCR